MHVRERESEVCDHLEMRGNEGKKGGGGGYSGLCKNKKCIKERVIELERQTGR